MEKTLKDKVAIVTGSSFGIGRATAIAFAQQGAKVVLVDVMEDPTTLDLIRKAGGEAHFVKCDVSSEEDVKNLIAEAIKTYKRIDFAFNNAGIEGGAAPAHECSTENWDKTIGVNLKGVWLCMKYEIIEMLKTGGGSIVNCASIAGLTGFAGLPAYVASKHGVVGITKSTALELSRQNIRVNVVCPGVIRTPMIDRFTGKNKEAEKAFADQEPIGRMGEPEEVASAVLWLCSPGASFVTGIELPVDGGWVAK